MRPRHPGGLQAREVVHHARLDLHAVQRLRRLAEIARIPLGHHPGVVIGLAPEHDAVDVGQLLVDLRERGHTPVEHEGECREVALEPVHELVAQRRDFAVLLGREPLEPRVARMHDEHLAAGLGDGADEVTHEVVGLGLVDADAVLDRHRQRDHIAHRLHAIGHEPRLGHQARTEGPALHALARAAAVEVDLVVAPLLRELRAGRQILGLAATELQRDRVLLGVEVEMARHVAVQQCAGRHHLGVEPGVAGDEAMEVSAMPIGPIHHGRNRQAPGGMRW